MTRISAALASMFVAVAPAYAQPVNAPKIVTGDDWTYRQTIERGAGWQQTMAEATVLRSTGDSVELSEKTPGSPAPPREQLIGADWSKWRSVNGRQTVVNKPLAFPLSVGKTWTVDYTEDHPNRQHSKEHFHTPYKVVDWENVTVPAGTFHALKIEAEGDWSAVIAPAAGAVSGTRVDAQGSTTVVQTGRATAATISGRTYKAFWYVPAIKRWVKSVEEYYSTNGQRTARYTAELESYKPGG